MPLLNYTTAAEQDGFLTVRRLDEVLVETGRAAR